MTRGNPLLKMHGKVKRRRESMKKAVGILVVVILLSGLLIGCEGTLIGSGNLKTQEYTFSDFNKVEVSSAFKFEITQSGEYGVSITVDDNVGDV